jgi:hypothetical protein
MTYQRGIDGGPWDESDPDVPSEDLDSGQVINFGSLRLQVPEGVEVQVQADQGTGRITQLSLRDGDSGMQLQPYASRKTGGMWPEVIDSLKSSINQTGGLVETAQGLFGIEVVAQIQAAGESASLQPARFVGVDGPRWFLRAVFMGKAARDQQAAARLTQILTSALVVRGNSAMAPGAPLVMNLPTNTNTDQASPVNAPNLNPFARGPEITETR